MKLLFPILAAAVLTFNMAYTQPGCPLPVAGVSLSANNISARINVAGDLFTDGNDAMFNYLPVAGQPATIFAAALWMGGFDLGGNLKITARSYRISNKTEYAAGPLDQMTGGTTVETCANWDIVFSTTKSRIENFLANLPNWQSNPAQARAEYPDIMGWPGNDNVHFFDIYQFEQPANQSLAPYVDTNGDGVYNPLDGDYPAVILQGKAPFLPTQITWCVFNDLGAAHQISGGAPLGMEVQLTCWAFGPEQEAPFTNTVFTSYKMIYRGTEPITDFRTGIWTDFDLGCYLDDYIGCQPSTNTFFCYNQDAVDGSPGDQCLFGVPTFGAATPVQSATFLDKPLHSFCYWGNPPFADPNLPIEFFRYLSCTDWAGNPLAVHDQDTTTFFFPGNPADPNGWSMCTDSFQVGDWRSVSSTLLGILEPGAVNQLTLAWTLHPNIAGPCNLGNMSEEIEVVQNAFDEGFTGLVGNKEPVWNDLGIRVWPNPAHSLIHFDLGSRSARQIICYDARGRAVYSENAGASGILQMNTSNWATGVYSAVVVTDAGAQALHFVVE